MCVRVYICVCVCVCIQILVYRCVCMCAQCVCVCVYVYVCVCVCMRVCGLWVERFRYICLCVNVAAYNPHLHDKFCFFQPPLLSFLFSEYEEDFVVQEAIISDDDDDEDEDDDGDEGPGEARALSLTHQATEGAEERLGDHDDQYDGDTDVEAAVVIPMADQQDGTTVQHQPDQLRKSRRRRAGQSATLGL